MKRLKTIVLVLVVLILISQLPFAYRRYKLGRLHAAIQQLNSQRKMEQSRDDTYAEYKGVIHVHSFLGGHSTGNFADIIAAANANQLHFVIMTEHPSKDFDTAAMTLQGFHGGVLFVNGSEVVTANRDRLLVLPGNETAAVANNSSTQDVLSQAKEKGALAFVAYPNEFKSWAVNGYDGVEVYNVFTSARRINPVITFCDSLWSYRSYPHLMFATFHTRPAEGLKQLDEAIVSRNAKLVAIAGNDAHANVGVTLSDSSGNTVLGIKLDPYERSFRLVRMHVLLPREQPLTAESLLVALHSGHCFIGFDLFGDTSGFRFSASNGSENKIAGDEINLLNATRLSVKTAVNSRIVLLKNGTAAEERNGLSTTDFGISEKGVYRVEVYLSQLPKPVSDQPWIISNPIYVR